MKYSKVFFSAVAAGVVISIGGAVFLSLDNKIAGALFFSVGLFTICTFGFHLFTGKLCYLFDNDRAYALSLPVIWLGNLCGCLLSSGLLQLTRSGAGFMAAAQKVCAPKLNDTLLSLFILGVFCNILIYIAVNGFKEIPHEIGKYLALFLGVTVFILAGFEHCVADMFYFTAAGVWSADTAVRLLVITAGNFAGGLILPLLGRYLRH